MLAAERMDRAAGRDEQQDRTFGAKAAVVEDAGAGEGKRVTSRAAEQWQIG